MDTEVAAHMAIDYENASDRLKQFVMETAMIPPNAKGTALWLAKVAYKAGYVEGMISATEKEIRHLRERGTK